MGLGVELAKMCRALLKEYACHGKGKLNASQIDDVVNSVKFGVKTLSSGPWYSHDVVSVQQRNSGFEDMIRITDKPELEFQETGEIGTTIALVPFDSKHQMDAELIEHAWELLMVFKKLRHFLLNTVELQRECEQKDADMALLKSATVLLEKIEGLQTKEPSSCEV